MPDRGPRVGRSRFDAVFYDDEIQVYRQGDPDNPRAFRWKP